MALETHEPHLLADQHARISRAVRFVTNPATLEPHCRMLERKRTTLVAVALEAARLVRSERLHHRRPDTAVWIMAIDAGHGAFGQLMVIRTLELGPDVQMAICALLVDRGGFADQQVTPAVGMNLMTSGAGNLILHVAAFEATHLRRLIRVAGETNAIGCGGSELCRVSDKGRVPRFGVFLAGTVAGLAGSSVPAALLVGINLIVRALRKSLGDVFVTGCTGVRADIAGRKRGLRRGA